MKKKKTKSRKLKLPNGSKLDKALVVRFTARDIKGIKKTAVKTGDIYMGRFVQRIVKEAIGQ